MFLPLRVTNALLFIHDHELDEISWIELVFSDYFWMVQVQIAAVPPFP
jgi:hypothetical protein